MSSAASERAAEDAVGQAGNPLSVLVGGRRSVGRSSLLRSRRRRLQLQFRRPKNGRFKRNIFGEETDGEAKEEKAARPPGPPVSAAAKATIFGQEQAQMRAAVEGDGLRRPSLRRGAFLHVQTHISTKSDGLRRSAEGGGRKREREGETANEPIFPPPALSHDNSGRRPRPRPRRPASP